MQPDDELLIMPSPEDIAFGRVAVPDPGRLLRDHLEIFNAPPTPLECDPPT